MLLNCVALTVILPQRHVRVRLGIIWQGSNRTCQYIRCYHHYHHIVALAVVVVFVVIIIIIIIIVVLDVIIFHYRLAGCESMMYVVESVSWRRVTVTGAGHGLLLVALLASPVCLQIILTILLSYWPASANQKSHRCVRSGHCRPSCGVPPPPPPLPAPSRSLLLTFTK